MKVRLTQPKNNKYYIRTVTGGLNGAVAGRPAISGANVLCNCVGYSNGRFNEICNDPNMTGTYLPFKYQLVCNAENFIESAKKQGLQISSTPAQGGIMVWKKGKTLSGSDGAGHVAVVEEVYEDGSILTSESGWNAWAFKTVRRYNTNGRWGQASGYTFRGCILNPCVKDGKVVPAPKLTVDGVGGPATIRALQNFLGTPADGILSGQSSTLHKKYFPSITSVEYGTKGSACVKQLQRWLKITQDGIWGKNTSVALQKELGVQADGVFGPSSVRALQQYLNDHDKATFPTGSTKPSTSVSTSGSKIASKASDYAWAYGTDSKKYAYKTGSAKASYKSALKKYMDKSNKISQSDCGYFVTTCVRASGISSKFLALKGVKESFPSVPSTMQVVHKGSKIPDGLLQAGDIIRYKKTSGQHALMYYGNGKIAEAGRGKWFPAIKKDTKKYNKSNVKFSTLQVLRAK